jgi:carboxymethylenebutenolidase
MRIPSFAALAALALVPALALAQGMPGHEHDHGAPDTAAAPAPARDPNLPADEQSARDALEHSPRHGEYLDVPGPGGTPIRTWVVYPERADKAPVVLIIHEIFGLSDWIRAVADQFAREGFLAVVPDLISGMGPGGGGTESMASRDSVVAVIRRVSPEMARERLDAVRGWALAQPSANGRLGTVGFCWGGARSFEYAAASPAPDAAVVYYGTSPDSATLARVGAPVLGLYGGDDARVNATIEPAKRVLSPLGKRYDAQLFEGAGHGFLRQQSGREGANLKATSAAWPRTLSFLREKLGKAKKK